MATEMEKTATLGLFILFFVVVAFLVPIPGHHRPLELFPFEFEAIRLSPSPSGKPMQSRKMHQQRVAWMCCASTSGHKSTVSVKPMKLVRQSIGEAIKQKENGTCTLVACTVAVEAVNRFQYKKKHGKRSTFPYRAAPPDELFEACRTDETWKPRVGASAGKVLTKIIREMGGVPATTLAGAPAPRDALPLRSWEMHWWGDSHGRGLSPEHVVELLCNNGPCIGVLWVVAPWYQHIDADADDGDTQVYTTGGCGRSGDARRKIKELMYQPGQVGWHAVVCFDYRFRDGQMHVLVLDNHTPTGPRRWIHVEEFHALYTLTVY